MNRRVLFALVVSLALVAAVPVQVGAMGHLVVGSQHTTDTDFNNADTLRHFTVEGSGDSANLAYTGGPSAMIDDFSDGDTTIENASWAGWNGDTGEISTCSPNYSGAPDPPSLCLEAASGDVNTTWADNGENTNQAVGIDWFTSTNLPSAHSNISLLKSGGGEEILSVNFTSTGSEEVVYLEWGANRTQVGTWEVAETKRVVFDPNPDTNEVHVYLDDNLVATPTVGDVSWARVAATVDSTDTTFSTEVTIDNLQLFNPPEAEYISANHSVSNAQEAFVNLSIQNDSSATVAWEYFEGGNWKTADETTYTNGGNKTVQLSQTATEWRVNVTGDGGSLYQPSSVTVYDEGVLFDNRAPEVDNSSASPSGGADLTDKGATLSIDVSDPTFATPQGESLSVEFQTKAPTASSWTTEGTETLNANGTAQLSVSNLNGGTYEWRAIITDSYGATTTSQTFTFNVPDTLYIRNVSSLNLITGSDVTVTFYDGGVVERTTSDGTVNLTGLPVETTMVVTVEHPDYFTRTIIIQNIYEQQTAYLLNDNSSFVEVRFTLQDQVGLYEENNPRLYIQRPINQSGTLDWQTVVGDEFGVQGVTTNLEAGQRYRLILENDQGDTRVLGSYTADVSETVPLTVGSIEPEGLSDEDEWTYGAGYENTTSGNFVTFQFEDEADATNTIWLQIHEYGNESNVLLANQSFNGPFGTFSLTEQVPSDELQTTWELEVTIERNGQTTSFSAISGPRSPILNGFPAWLMALISVGSLWVVGGLFSQLNGDVGGLVIAGMGAIYWYLDFLPEAIGQGVVALALIMAGIVFINERRGEAGI